MWNRQRNRDTSGLQRAEKSNDVFDSLRCQYHCPITGRPHMPERLGDIEHSPIQLRPGQGFGNTGPVLLVIDVGDGRTIGVHTGALAQRGGNRRRDYGSTLPLTLRQR